MKVTINFFAGIKDFSRPKHIVIDFPTEHSISVNDLIPKLHEYYGENVISDCLNQGIYFAVNNNVKNLDDEILINDGDRCAFFNSIAGG